MSGEVQKGVNNILLYRIKGADTATKITFQVDHEVSKEKDSDRVSYKGGTLVNIGESEEEISGTFLFDPLSVEMNDLEDAYDDGKTVEIWEIDSSLERPEVENDHPDYGKYWARYYQVEVTSFNRTANGEDFAEVDITMPVNHRGRRGWATMTEEQELAVGYLFTDTTEDPDEVMARALNNGNDDDNNEDEDDEEVVA